MITPLIEYLSGFVSEHKIELFKRVIDFRTRYLTVVLENIYQAQNASAVIRSCECFGIQDLHIIENNNNYRINPDVALGSHQWLNIYRYNQHKNNTSEALKQLREKGYRIVATTPHHSQVNLDEFDLEKGKAAFFFGNEHHGLSPEVLDSADEYLTIPMFGFTESLNISVAAAIVLNNLCKRLRMNNHIDWQLNLLEQQEILLQWYKNAIKDADGIIRHYFSKHTEE